MSDIDIEKTLHNLQTLAAEPPADATAKRKLYDAARKLALAVEDPYDTIYRVVYSPMDLAVAQIAGQLKIFPTLMQQSPVSTANLSAALKADALLIGRILRYLSSHGYITEVDEDLFAANKLTETLSIDGFRAGINQSLVGIMPSLQAAPEFLKTTGYKNPSDNSNTPFQAAFKTELPSFVWLQSRPDLVAEFGLWMAALHNGQKTWLDVFDFESAIEGDTKPDATTDRDMPVIFVDVGGGVGPQCALLKHKLPNLMGRVILQDLPQVLEFAIPTPGVEKMAVNFLEGQPIKGASVYYMRNILHDYSDEKAVVILQNLITALGPNSVILIDEMVIPNKGVHPHATEQDLVMMTTLASMERTQKQWSALLGKAGLKLLQQSVYNEDTSQAIQVVKY